MAAALVASRASCVNLWHHHVVYLNPTSRCRSARLTKGKKKSEILGENQPKNLHFTHYYVENKNISEGHILKWYFTHLISPLGKSLQTCERPSQGEETTSNLVIGLSQIHIFPFLTSFLWPLQELDTLSAKFPEYVCTHGVSEDTWCSPCSHFRRLRCM